MKIEVPEKKSTTHNRKDTMKRNQPKRKKKSDDMLSKEWKIFYKHK